MRSYLDFEKPIADLEGKVQELKALTQSGDVAAIGEDIAKLEAKLRDKFVPGLVIGEENNDAAVEA